MHHRAIITNLKFTYAKQRKTLRTLLRYLQYRNDKTSAEHVRQFDEHGHRINRWTNQGLGETHREILDTALDLATTGLKNNVGARLLVIAPEVHLMDAIPQERRTDVLRELTEATVENWFERINLPTAEYAYVVHEAEPAETRPDGRLKDETALSQTYLHTHVILAATVPGFETERQDYKVYERQIEALHEAGREAMAVIWQRELGLERVDELNQELEDRTQRYLALDAMHERNVESLGRDTEPHALDKTLDPAPLPPPQRNLDLGLGLERDG